MDSFLIVPRVFLSDRDWILHDRRSKSTAMLQAGCQNRLPIRHLRPRSCPPNSHDLSLVLIRLHMISADPLSFQRDHPTWMSFAHGRSVSVKLK